MCAQISFALVPPDRVIYDCDDGDGGFFRCCAERLVMDNSVEQAWVYAVDKCAAVRALKTDEHRLLCELGQQLGIYDMQLQ